VIAFVMSGGGSRGALQAGAIFALREAGIMPDFVVGSSVGALNALHLACHGLEEAGLTRLRKTWEKVHKRNVFPSNPWLSAFRFLQGKDSLHGGKALRKFVTKQIPSQMKTFGDLLMPCYLTATDLRTQRLYLFGESADSEFLEAALASASIPVLHPPIPYQDLQLVDGGVLDNVPAEVAMDKGALEIWVLNVGYGGQRLQAAKGVQEIFGRTINVVLTNSLFKDLDRAMENRNVQLHHLHLSAFRDVSIMDFSRTKQMMEAGNQTARAYLVSPRPLSFPQPPASEFVAPLRIPGAREWVSATARHIVD